MPPLVSPRLKLRLAPAAEAAVRSGHPWIFDRAIRGQNRDGQAGEMAVVYDRRDQFMAVGFYDPASPIRVRVVHAGKPVTIDAAWWRQRLQAAIDRRSDLTEASLVAASADGTAPSWAQVTNGYRLINGESDGWPGLVLDRYATTLVMKIYTSAWLSRLNEIVPLLREMLPWATAMVLRMSRNLVVPAACTPSITEGFLFSDHQPPHETVVFHENNLRFEADVRFGQKTGFFLDQRDNRSRVETLAAGRDVLNAFSFSGGFSLYAARGGARSVVDVDISDHALASARRNFALNIAEFPAVAACLHRTIQADAFEWLATPAAPAFDLVIVDPPSLARRESDRHRAMDAYARLHASALARLRPGGILVAASCSAHVDEDAFYATVRRVVSATGRRFQELWTSSHASDHPATFPEARYLKCLALRVSS